MQRVKRSTAVATMPAAPVGGTPGFFTGGNPGTGTPASVPGYEWFNGVQEELIGLILRGGLTASDADLAQVRKSLDRLFGGGLVTYSANTALTVDDAGVVLVDASGGARTITLPAANALGGRPIQFRIVKSDNSANAVTVQRAGTDTIEGNTSIALRYQWDSATLTSDGSAAWILLAGGIGPQSLAASGYKRLPGGLIMQWGRNNTLGTVTVTLPVAFPNAGLTVLAGDDDASLTVSGAVFASSGPNVTQITLYGSDTNYWFALGY